MTAPAPLPAGWSPNTSVLGDQWAALPEDVKATALQVAVRTLWALSGRRFGTTEITLAPFIPPPRRRWYDHRPTQLGVYPYRGGLGFDAAGGFAVAGCGVTRAFRLPGPVVSVAEVVVDALVVPAAVWTLDPDGLLVRTDGGGWPIGQDVLMPRWSVRYTLGLPAPMDGDVAAARYALELGRGMTADPACVLPSRTRDVTRQGISLSLAGPEELADSGLTGVPAVDVWLRAVNPEGVAQSPGLFVTGPTRHRVLAVHTSGVVP